MYSAFLERTQKSIGALRRHLETSDAIRAAVHEQSAHSEHQAGGLPVGLLSPENAPDRIEWRIIDHCTAVTRIYAIYEQFAHEMIREHLALLQANATFDKLPPEVQLAYRRGLSTILEKKDGPRYGHLSLATLISQYNSALTSQTYVLEPLAMLMHEQNLRMPELARVFSSAGISRVDSWIEKHRSIKAFFEKGERLGASADHELGELIKYRNEAAHGSISVDDLMGLDYLREFCDFADALCEAISEKVQLVGLDFLIECGRASERGRADECLRRGYVLISTLTGELAVGETVYLCGDDYCFERTITSLQIQDGAEQKISCNTPTEVGIGLHAPGRKNSRIVSIAAPVPPNNE